MRVEWEALQNYYVSLQRELQVERESAGNLVEWHILFAAVPGVIMLAEVRFPNACRVPGPSAQKPLCMGAPLNPKP